MGTKHIVPRAEGEGGIGTATLGWGELFITNTTNDSATQGGKLTLTSNDGNAMQSGSRLGVIEFKGAESSSALTIGARIEAICDAVWSATENGASLKFYTTDANASESLVLTLDSNKLAVFSGAVAITGNLTVNGTTTTVNSTIVTIDDPVFTLGGDTAPVSETTQDKGIEFRYHTGSAAKIGFFGWDDSASAFTFIADATNNSEVFSGTAGNAIFTNITGTLQTAAQTNITSVGALNGGTITSGFGAINNGASAITTTGLISGGSLDIDNVLINGTTIGHTDDTDLMTLANGVLTVAGELDAVSLDISGDADIDGTLETDALSINGTAVTASAADINLIDGITNGTVIASKAIITDSNKDITGGRNITISGELDAATLDISGNADIDGTLEADAITVNGTALNTVIAGVTVTNATNAVTVTGAAQGNITSLGTLTGLSVSDSLNGSYVSTISNTFSTNSLSFGLKIKAGTNGSDHALRVVNHNESSLLLNVNGNGNLTVGGDATFGGDTEIITSSTPTLQLTQSGSTNYKGYIKLAGNDLEIRGSSGAMEFYNGSVDGNSSALRLSISSGGDVKIGDSTTDVTSKLTVSGNGSVNTATFMYDGNAGTYFDIDTEAANGSVILTADARSGNYPPMLFKTGGSTRLTISSGGLVGINTSSPRYLLDFAYPQGSTTGSTDYIGFGVHNGPSSGVGTTIGSGIIWKANYSNYTKRSAGLVMVAEGNYFRAGLAFYTNGTADQTTDWVERMRISSGGNVGIGTTSPVKTLDVQGQLAISNSSSSYWYLDRNDSSGNFDVINDSNQVKLTISSGGVATFSNYIDTPEVRQGGEFMIGRSSNIIRIGSGDSSDSLAFYAGASQRMTISSGGAIGQSVTPLTDPYVASGEQWMTYQIGKGGIFAAYKNNNESMFGFNTYTKVTDGAHKAIISDIGGSATRYYADRITFNTLTTSGTAQTQTEVMRISSGGNVGIGELNPHRKLNVASGTNGDGIYLSGLGTSSGMATNDYKTLEFAYSDTDTSFGSAIRFEVANGAAHGGKMSFWTDNSSGTLTRAVTIFKDQSVTFAGTVNVSGTKNFYIDHPLESKKDTHSLIHSSVESPEVNNLYRGKVDLVNGNATVNLDTVSNMTEGTFVALNDNTQCFTTNETNWDAVKGSVDGNELTISCQNSSSTANVSWMVISNRKDIAIMESSGTDSNGNLIVEEVKVQNP